MIITWHKLLNGKILLIKQQVKLHIYIHILHILKTIMNSPNFCVLKSQNFPSIMYSVPTNSTYVEEADILVWWKAQRESFSVHGDNSDMRLVRHMSCFSQDSRQRMFTSRVIRLSLAVPHAHTLFTSTCTIPWHHSGHDLFKSLESVLSWALFCKTCKQYQCKCLCARLHVCTFVQLCAWFVLSSLTSDVCPDSMLSNPTLLPIFLLNLVSSGQD